MDTPKLTASQRYYQKNKKAYLERNQLKRARMREWLIEQKNKPCADCRGSFPYFVMDFDHREGEDKKLIVSRAICALSWRRMLEEIAKCDLVCANCHRVRTYKRDTWETSNPYHNEIQQ